MTGTGVEAADHGAPTGETAAVEDLTRPCGSAADIKGAVGVPGRAGTRDRRRAMTATAYLGGAGDIVDDGAPIDDRERAVPPVTDDQLVAVRPRRAGPVTVAVPLAPGRAPMMLEEPALLLQRRRPPS